MILELKIDIWTPLGDPMGSQGAPRGPRGGGPEAVRQNWKTLPGLYFETLANVKSNCSFQGLLF